MKTIKLTQNKTVKVDDSDYQWLNQYKWYFHVQGYAVRKSKGKAILMHRLIMNTPEGMDTDHINRDKLDNRRENLRVCTHAENMRNRNIHRPYKPRTPGSSAGRISFSTLRGVWEVKVQRNGIRKYYGSYKKKEDAETVVKNVILKLDRMGI